MFDALRKDIQYAVRSLSKTPGFLLAAVLTLGLGIGANTAIFTIVDETLFRPLAFSQPEQLADIFTFNKVTQQYLSTSYPDYEDLRSRTSSFQQLSAFVRMPLAISMGDRRVRLPVEAVSGNFFKMLELPPAAGRSIREDDDSVAASRVAMLSEETADANWIGRAVLVEDQPFTVIGLVPRRYHGTNLNWGDPPRVWIPLQTTAAVFPRFRAIGIFQQRSAQWLLLTGRLKPGVNVARAQAEVQAITGSIEQSSPSTNRNISAMVFQASRSKFWPAYRDSIARSLMVFAMAAGLVLLLTCANLSNLLLSRAVGRQREFAIRLAVGAGRGRLVRQLLTESLLLIAPSCAAALGIANGLGRLLAHFPNALGLPLALEGGMETRVLIFCIGLSILTAVVFGLTPALQSTRPDVLPALKESGNGFSGSGQNVTRDFLLVVQVAFSMVLLTGGGLFVRSVMRAWAVDTGIRTGTLLTAGFEAPMAPASSERMLRAQREFLPKLRTLPGVASASLASSPPMNLLHSKTQIRNGAATLAADQLTVGAGFFETTGIAVMSGREFGERDSQASTKVAIINEELATRLWPDENPLGRTLALKNGPLQVVGIVRDSRYGSVWEQKTPYLYVPYSQSTSPASYVIFRADMNPGELAPFVRKAWNDVLPNSPLIELRTADDLLKTALAPQRVAAGMFGAFGFVSVFLAAVGLYSVMAYSVARRTREIGIRLAIGASPAAVVRQILGSSFWVSGIGILAGAGISASLVHFLADQVKGGSVYDIATFSFVAALLIAVTFVAAWIPARRAARIDPQVALRTD